MSSDLRQAEVVDRSSESVGVLIHMAGSSVERPLPKIIESKLVGLRAVLGGMRRHRAKRIVFASFSHAIGMPPGKAGLVLDRDFQPDGSYGLSKVQGQGLARLNWDKHGIEGACVRIGSAIERPRKPRTLAPGSGWRTFSTSPCAAPRLRSSATWSRGAS